MNLRFQGKTGDLRRVNGVARRDKTASDIACHHIADGVGVAGVAGNDRIKILVSQKVFQQIADTGPFQLKDKGGGSKIGYELTAVQRMGWMCGRSRK